MDTVMLSIGVALGFALGALAGLLWQSEKVNRLLERMMRQEDEIAQLRSEVDRYAADDHTVGEV